MKVNGKVNFKGFNIPMSNGTQATMEGIEIEYEANFSIGEITQALNLIDIIPEKLAGAYRKFLEYQKEFGTEKPVETEEKKETAEDIANNIMNDMAKYEAETAVTEEE